MADQCFTGNNVSQLNVPCCSRCRTAPRRKGQRYCFKCHAEDEKARRHKRKAQMQSNAAIMEQVRNAGG